MNATPGQPGWLRPAQRVLAGVAAVVAAIALALLAMRAMLRLEPRWDTFMYHLPFAALRGGLGIDYDLNETMRHRYEGFPFLPHLVQGLLWRLTGSVNATGVVNALAFGTFLGYAQVALRARFWIVALIALTAPLVVIHLACSYVDLFGNCFLAIAASSCLYLFVYPEQRSPRVFLGGLVGLVLAAWSKYQLVPLVGLFGAGFAALAWADRAHLLAPTRRRAVLLVGGAAVLIALPYLKNAIVYGNPFWPVRVPFFGDAFPYAEIGDNNLAQQPPPLRGSSQFSLFLHSIFEIDHPTSYPDRQRWIIDQGNAGIAFRSGGFWWLGVVCSLLSLCALLVLQRGRRGLVAAAAVIGVVLFVAVLPQSHELRYYLFLPLTWAAAIGFLQPGLAARWPAAGLALVAGVLLLFGDMAWENRAYYTVERLGIGDAAHYWHADDFWKQMVGERKYCAVDMVPLPFLMTGPTLHEFSVVDRLHEYGCPDDAIVIQPRVRQHSLDVASLINESLALYNAHNFTESAAAAQRALQFDPASAVAFNNLCAAQLALTRRDAAIAACERALQLAPDFTRARSNLDAAQRLPQP